MWSGVSHDKYGPSGNGCVTLTFASSTGGSTSHYCGAAAKSFCASAFANSDRISLLARPQCDLAGLDQVEGRGRLSHAGGRAAGQPGQRLR